METETITRFIVASLLAAGLTFAACARSGFYGTTQTDRQSGIRQLSVWRWFGYFFLVFYAGVPVVWWLLTSTDEIASAVQSVESFGRTLAWLLPVVVTGVALTLIPVWVWWRNRQTAAAAQPVEPPAPVAPPTVPAVPGMWSLPRDVTPDALQPRHDDAAR